MPIFSPTPAPRLSRIVSLAFGVLVPRLSVAADAPTAPAVAGAPATVTTAPPPTASPTAVCRAPQATRPKPGERWTVDSPAGQAADWAAWMTEQLAMGRDQFIVVPFKPTGKDSDGSDGPPDEPLQILCAW